MISLYIIFLKREITPTTAMQMPLTICETKVQQRIVPLKCDADNIRNEEIDAKCRIMSKI